MGLRRGKKSKNATNNESLPPAPLPMPGELPPMPLPGQMPAPLPDMPLPPAANGAPEPLPLPDAPPTEAAPASLSEKVESSDYGALWAKRSEKPLQQIYGHIDRISNQEAGSLLDRYADRFGHSLDREIIVMRKASLEEKHAEVRDAPTVELIGEEEPVEDLSPAEELKAVEDELRQLKPLYQAAKANGDSASLAELKPVLQELMNRRKELKGSQTSSAPVVAVAEAAGDSEMDALFEQFVHLANDLLGDHLPESIVTEFMNSPGFDLLKSVHAAPTETTDTTRSEFYAMVDDLLGNMSEESINAFVASPDFDIYRQVGEAYKGA